jgi:flagellar hook-associated protein FlgK
LTLLIPNEKTIDTRINNVASSVQGLTLRDDPYSARNKLTLLQVDIRELYRLVSTVTTRAKVVKALVNDANTSINLSIGDVCSLRKQIKKPTEITFSLRTTINNLIELIESSIVRYLTSLSN